MAALLVVVQSPSGDPGLEPSACLAKDGYPLCQEHQEQCGPLVLPVAFTDVSNAMKYLEKTWAPRTDTLSIYMAGFSSGRAWQ